MKYGFPGFEPSRGLSCDTIHETFMRVCTCGIVNRDSRSETFQTLKSLPDLRLGVGLLLFAATSLRCERTERVWHLAEGV